MNVSNVKEYKKEKVLIGESCMLPIAIFKIDSSIISDDNTVIKRSYKLVLKTYQNQRIVHVGDEDEIDSINRQV